MTLWAHYALAASLALYACKGDRKDKPSSSPSPLTRSSATMQRTSASELSETGSLILKELVALESERDVTCWTSFRQLDWFIAEKNYSEVGTLAKVRAAMELVRTLWAKASQGAVEGPLGAEAIRQAAQLPEVSLGGDLDAKLESFANDIGLKNFKDYQKTAEHLRLLLSVVQDEILHSPEGSELAPLGSEALAELADSATVLSLLLLKESSGAADELKSTEIGAEAVHVAYQKIAADTGLVSSPRPGKRISDRDIAEILSPMTGTLIEGKAKALKEFNKGAGDVLADINRVAKVPLSKAALEHFKLELQSFTHFVVAGFDPMRADNYLSDGAFAASVLPRRGYLQVSDAQNSVMQLFPHHTLNNGDVMVSFQPNPGPAMPPPGEPFELRILDHEMNGVRDSALHWLVLGAVYEEKRFAMDPFAAEYLSEVVSMMMATWMRQAERIAEKRGASTIDLNVARAVRSKAWVMVQPQSPEASTWTEDKQQAKRKALAALDGPIFAEAKKAGMPAPVLVDAASGGQAFNLQTIMGGGVAVGDINGDGYQDVYLAGPGLGRLLVNQGAKGPGRFVDETEAWGLPLDLHDGHGALFFDREGDGDLDLLVLRSEHASELYEFEGTSFLGKAKERGLATHYGAQVAHVFDADGDDDLDIYIGYYGSAEAHQAQGKKRSLPSMDGRNGSPNQLWRNDGKSGYTEVGKQAGLADTGWALAVSSFDYNGDDLLDLYVANDFGANVFFENEGSGHFKEVSEETGTRDRGSGMNVGLSDVNKDGFWDFYVTNIDMFSKNIKVVFPRDESTIDIDKSLTQAFQYLSGNKLYVHDGDKGYRSEEGRRFEPLDRGWAWDGAFFDMDNDGDDDLYVANGWIDGSYAGGQQNQLYLNDEGMFYLAQPDGAQAFAGNSRSVAVFDGDNDGDLDLLVNGFREAPRYLENRSKAGNGWVSITLEQSGKNPRAIGSKIRVYSGEWSTMRQVHAGRGYLSQNPTTQWVGLGNRDEVTVEVTWPDGSKEIFGPLESKKTHQLTKNSSTMSGSGESQ